MNLLAVMGSPRKGKTTDTLVDRAIGGALSVNPGLAVKKIVLADHDIRYCTNCLTCRDRVTDEPFSPCVLRDDMDSIYEDVLASDLLIFGTPLHMGYATSLMMTFLERICWTFAKPEGKVLTISACPIPRSGRKRGSITIITNSIVPPVYRKFCDDASSLIRGTVRDSLNAKTVGDLYAGNIETRGVEHYLDKAFSLGVKLVNAGPV
jgi:NAD(P)H-dependent FMN reductase